MNQIKNVVFDLGGVLVDLDLQRCITAFEQLGLEPIARLINPYHPAAMIGRLEKGEIDFHQTCDLMREAADCHTVTDEQIAAAYGSFLTAVPRVKMRQIEELRRRGIRTYVLSNNNPASMEVIRRYFEADGHDMNYYFDHQYLSYEMQALKPDPEIFHKMIAHSGMQPEETLFIDDAEHNIRTGQELGFAVYQPAPGEDFGHLFDALT